MAVQRNLEGAGNWYVNRWLTGLYTQRSPLFVPISAMGVQLIQRMDALWSGLNMEISSVNTIIRRPAFTRFCSAQFGSSDYPLNYYSFQNTSGTIYPMVDTPAHLYHFTTSAITTVYNKLTTARSSMQRVGDWLYVCDGTSTNKWNGTTAENWGIQPPVSAPSLSFGAGSLSPTSGYTYVYCYVNSTTGHVSQASPLSANTGALTNQNITVSYAASSDAQVDKIWIFRTDDGGGLYYFLAQVNNGTSTYTDSTVDSGLNDDIVAPLAPLNAPPPTGANLSCFWSGRLWVAVKNILYFAMGPDCTTGVGEEAFVLSNQFKLPLNVTGLAPTSQGLIVFTPDNAYVVTGTNSSDYEINEWQANFGIKTPNALTQDGDVVFVFTSRGQLFQIGTTLTEIGFPIRKKLAVINPSNVSLTIHRSGDDEGLFISDGQQNIYRFSIAFQCWCPPAQPNGAIGIIGSIETSSGIWTLLAGSTTGSSYIRGRNTASWTDDGTGTYACNVTVGSITVGAPGSKEIIAGVGVSATAIGTYPTIGVLLNEISGTFNTLPNPVPEPPELPASKTISRMRHYLKSCQSPLPQQVEHMQVNISFPAENFQAEILDLALL